MPKHLANVVLHEYTESIPRDHNLDTGRCGALPAQAFRPKYPRGCYRRINHAGAHSAERSTAQSLDLRDAQRTRKRELKMSWKG